MRCYKAGTMNRAQQSFYAFYSVVARFEYIFSITKTDRTRITHNVLSSNRSMKWCRGLLKQPRREYHENRPTGDIVFGTNIPDLFGDAKPDQKPLPAASPQQAFLVVKQGQIGEGMTKPHDINRIDPRFE